MLGNANDFTNLEHPNSELHIDNLLAKLHQCVTANYDHINKLMLPVDKPTYPFRIQVLNNRLYNANFTGGSNEEGRQLKAENLEIIKSLIKKLESLPLQPAQHAKLSYLKYLSTVKANKAILPFITKHDTLDQRRAKLRRLLKEFSIGDWSNLVFSSAIRDLNPVDLAVLYIVADSAHPSWLHITKTLGKYVNSDACQQAKLVVLDLSFEWISTIKAAWLSWGFICHLLQREEYDPEMFLHGVCHSEQPAVYEAFFKNPHVHKNLSNDNWRKLITSILKSLKNIKDGTLKNQFKNIIYELFKEKAIVHKVGLDIFVHKQFMHENQPFIDHFFQPDIIMALTPKKIITLFKVLPKRREFIFSCVEAIFSIHEGLFTKMQPAVCWALSILSLLGREGLETSIFDFEPYILPYLSQCNKWTQEGLRMYYEKFRKENKPSRCSPLTWLKLKDEHMKREQVKEDDVLHSLTERMKRLGF